MLAGIFSTFGTAYFGSKIISFLSLFDSIVNSYILSTIYFGLLTLLNNEEMCKSTSSILISKNSFSLSNSSLVAFNSLVSIELILV